MDFNSLVNSRRSIRVFKNEKVPDEIILTALRHATLAPNSSNLQPWKFYYVKSELEKQKLKEYCFNQLAAKTASSLVVVTASTHTWNENREKILAILSGQPVAPPASVLNYYNKVVPFTYNFTLKKKIIYKFKRFFKLNIENTILTKNDLKCWAIKQAALACENLMLSLKAQGVDSCPMEGFYPQKISELLKLHQDEHICMVIAAGFADEKSSLWGPRIRLKEDDVIKIV